jgi:hypothetical protein
MDPSLADDRDAARAAGAHSPGSRLLQPEPATTRIEGTQPLLGPALRIRRPASDPRGICSTQLRLIPPASGGRGRGSRRTRRVEFFFFLFGWSIQQRGSSCRRVQAVREMIAFSVRAGTDPAGAVNSRRAGWPWRRRTTRFRPTPWDTLCPRAQYVRWGGAEALGRLEVVVGASVIDRVGLAGAGVRGCGLLRSRSCGRVRVRRCSWLGSSATAGRLAGRCLAIVRLRR